MILRYLLACSICLGDPSFAQVAPTIQWQNALGGTLKEEAGVVTETSDGGYLVVGHTFSNNGDVSGNHGGRDMWVVRLDASGALLWQKALGGTGMDCGSDVEAVSDGGYVVVGDVTSNDGDVSGNHGSHDAWVVKLDASGGLQWQRCLGGTGAEVAWSMATALDGGSYLVAGQNNSNDGDVSGNHGTVDAWVVLLDLTGNFLWQRSLGGSDQDAVTTAQPTIDGGWVVGGFTDSNDGDVSGAHGERDAWVVKLDGTGDLQWQKPLGGSGDDGIWGIEQTGDGGYIVAGYSDSNDGDVSGNQGNSDAWVVKLDAAGALQWQRCLGGSGSDFGRSIHATPDGGYILAGSSGSDDGDVSGNHGNADYWMVKLDATGDPQWQKPLGGSLYDACFSMERTSDGGYVLGGEVASDDGDVTGYHGIQDIWVVKLTGTVGIGEAVPAGRNVHVRGDGTIHVELKGPAQQAMITIIDALGQVVLGRQMRGSSCTVHVDHLVPGAYTVVVTSAGGSIARQLVLQ